MAITLKLKLQPKIIKKTVVATVSLMALITVLFFLRASSLGSLLSRAGAAGDEIEIAPKTMSFWVDATGILRATTVQNFGGPRAVRNYWQFQIVSLAPEGKSVKKGDSLITFDAQRLREDLQRFQNEFDQAAKEMEKTKVQIDLERQDLTSKLAAAENNYEKLKLKQGTVPTVEASNKIEMDRLALEQARREVEALRERLEWHAKSSEATYNIIQSKKARAENKVNELKKGMEDFEAKADRDGVVVYKVKWNGEKFQVGETVWSGQPVMEIPDLNTIIAEALVPEVDIGRVKIGQTVEVAIDAFPGKSYRGMVASIGKLVRPKAWDIPNKVLEVGVALDNLDTSIMRPGMSIKAKIETASIGDSLVVPIKAVLVAAQGATVKVKAGPGWREQNVKLGATNGVDVVITEGLKAGDRIASDFSKAK